MEGGVDDTAAAWGADVLLLHPTALAAEHTARDRERDAARVQAAIARADAHQLPSIKRLGAALFEGAGPDRFDWTLDVLIAGITGMHRLAPKDRG